jgi:hypothetical protein
MANVQRKRAARPGNSQLWRMSMCAIVAIACLSCVTSAWAQKKSIVIGLDGFGYGDKGFSNTATPRMDSLIDGSWAAGYNGAYSDQAFAGGVIGEASQQPTVSGPGWTSMVTGVWANKHNVYDNSFTSPNVATYPAYLGTAEAADNSLTTAAILWWQIYNDTIFDPLNGGNPNDDLDYQFVSAGDFALTADTVEKLDMDGFNDVDADLTFLELGDLDGAGHSCGSSGACYEAELIQQDLYVGQILDAITGRLSFASEEWQIIITSDHGHRAGGGHGGHSEVERTIPFIVSSQSLTQGVYLGGVSQVDVAPTVLDHFGIAIPGNYDGVSRASGGEICLWGDFNDDCVMDTDDWALLRGGQHTDLTGLTPLQAYQMGDLNGDLLNNHADFILFKTEFEKANGANSFAAMLTSVPEPDTIILLLVAAILGTSLWGRRGLAFLARIGS